MEIDHEGRWSRGINLVAMGVKPNPPNLYLMFSFVHALNKLKRTILAASLPSMGYQFLDCVTKQACVGLHFTLKQFRLTLD